MGEFWFLVDAGWMNRWVDFITGKAGPPGMITNYNLFNQRRPSTAEKHDGETPNIPYLPRLNILTRIIELLCRFTIKPVMC